MALPRVLVPLSVSATFLAGCGAADPPGPAPGPAAVASPEPVAQRGRVIAVERPPCEPNDPMAWNPIPAATAVREGGAPAVPPPAPPRDTTAADSTVLSWTTPNGCPVDPALRGVQPPWAWKWTRIRVRGSPTRP